LSGTVSWEALLLIVSLTIVFNATTAIGIGWLVYRVCILISTLERRLQRLEMQMERLT
jgi:hypothetical protein